MDSSKPYSEYDWTYDGSYGIEYIYPKLRELLDPARNRVILDIGCGNGFLGRRLLEEGFDVYGIDASESGIKRASGHTPGRFFRAEIGALPSALKHISFDTIISTEVIEHLYDPFALLNMSREILSHTDGQLLVSTPYHGFIKNLLIVLSNRFDRHFDALRTSGHIKFWSRRMIGHAMEQCGFEVTDFRGCGRLPYLWKSMLVKARLTSHG